MADKTHDHEYKAVTYTIQEAVVKHWDYKDHCLAILSHEKVKLFCVKCGETKDVEQEPQTNETTN